jgi:hypothetical protein
MIAKRSSERFVSNVFVEHRSRPPALPGFEAVHCTACNCGTNQDGGADRRLVRVSICMTLPIFPSGLHQSFDFALCQVFARPKFMIGKPPRHHCPYFFGWRD